MILPATCLHSPLIPPVQLHLAESILRLESNWMVKKYGSLLMFVCLTHLALISGNFPGFRVSTALKTWLASFRFRPFLSDESLNPKLSKVIGLKPTCIWRLMETLGFTCEVAIVLEKNTSVKLVLSGRSADISGTFLRRNCFPNYRSYFLITWSTADLVKIWATQYKFPASRTL